MTPGDNDQLQLRVVEGDEKGCLESDTLKYGCESHGART
jgi:hypothetical protein